jgi:hypothetical protein
MKDRSAARVEPVARATARCERIPGAEASIEIEAREGPATREGVEVHL